MKDNEITKRSGSKTKTGKFFTFLQILNLILLIMALLTTLYFPLFSLFVGIEVIILLIFAIITLGLIILNDKYRSLWDSIGNASASIPIIYNIGYYVYGAAILFSLITLIYYAVGKNVNKRKKRIIFSVVMLALGIGLIIVHHLIFINLPR